MHYNKYKLAERLYSLLKTFRKQGDKMAELKLTQASILENMKNEIAFLKYTEKIFDIKSSEFTYYNNNKSDTLSTFNTLCDKHNVTPHFVPRKDKQLAGFDYEYNGFSIDLKVHGKNYDRVFVELFRNETTGFYYSKHLPYTHIYANIMLYDNTIRCYPIDLLVDIVNHKNVNSLHLPSDFYNRQKYFARDLETSSTKLHGSTGFAISADILTKAMRYYLPTVCQNNASMGELISNYTPIKCDIGDFVETKVYS